MEAGKLPNKVVVVEVRSEKCMVSYLKVASKEVRANIT